MLTFLLQVRNQDGKKQARCLFLLQQRPSRKKFTCTLALQYSCDTNMKSTVCSVPQVLNQDGKKQHAVRYAAASVEEEVYLHPRSALHTTAPEYVVYMQLIRTVKRPYMAGVTAVDAHWLAALRSPLRQLSPEPLVRVLNHVDIQLCCILLLLACRCKLVACLEQFETISSSTCK